MSSSHSEPVAASMAKRVDAIKAAFDDLGLMDEPTYDMRFRTQGFWPDSSDDALVTSGCFRAISSALTSLDSPDGTTHVDHLGKLIRVGMSAPDQTTGSRSSRHARRRHRHNGSQP
jgi:hypothetical protein